jgi:hypothetical protein
MIAPDAATSSSKPRRMDSPADRPGCPVLQRDAGSAPGCLRVHARDGHQATPAQPTSPTASSTSSRDG